MPKSDDPSPAPPSRRWRLVRRVAVAVAFVTVGFAAVCHGFGLLGFGTEDHAQRNFVTSLPLVAGGVVFAWSQRAVVRAGVTALALGLATASWWFVPCEGGLSLQDAVARRDELKERLAATPPDDIESGVAIKLSADRLQSQYGKLGASLRGHLGLWGYKSGEANAARFRQIPLDALPAAREFEERLRTLASHYPDAGRAVGAAIENWVDRAIARRRGELENLPRGDWAAFERTAPDRRALTEFGPVVFAFVARDSLAKAEEDWITDSVEALIERHTEAGSVPARVYHGIEQDILALPALDTDEERFKAARRRLFDLAHASATDETARLIKAGRWNAAFDAASRHAADWDETAAMLGARDVKRLEALREKCAALVVPGADDPPDGPEIAPPPRAKLLDGKKPE